MKRARTKIQLFRETLHGMNLGSRHDAPYGTQPISNAETACYTASCHIHC
jgi:hypothetical protein